jgi:hypothetical protein
MVPTVILIPRIHGFAAHDHRIESNSFKFRKFHGLEISSPGIKTPNLLGAEHFPIIEIKSPLPVPL